MSAEVVIANFLRIASQDLEGAKLLANANNRNAVYLCEQAAEKIIRAVLTSEGHHAGIKHQLDQMVEDVPAANPIKPLLEAIEHLAAFATAYRYPSPVGRIKATPPASDVTTYIADVERALNEAVRRFGVDLTRRIHLHRRQARSDKGGLLEHARARSRARFPPERDDAMLVHWRRGCTWVSRVQWWASSFSSSGVGRES